MAVWIVYTCKNSLSLERVLEILNTPDVERVSNKPAAKPKADEVYVFTYGSDHTKICKQAIYSYSECIMHKPNTIAVSTPNTN